MVCHARAVARRLDMPGFAAFDLLELFAFVRPARFCVPTPRGLAATLGLVPPHDMAEACVALGTAARALLQELGAETDPNARAIAEAADRAGWIWGPAVLAALPVADATALRRAPGSLAGLRAWQSLAEWQERPPPPPPGNMPVAAEEARGRLAALLGDDAEARPQQADYAAAVAAAFAPREEEDRPRAVLAEAGTGVGKTLGYIAPASLWAEKNQGSVWISTFTRNLQAQISGELDRLYPDPDRKRRRVVVRKGRENFLCLLNYEDAVRNALGRASPGTAPLALIARWIGATGSGDLVAGSMRSPTGAANACIRPVRISAAALSSGMFARRATPGSSSPTMRWSWRRRHWAASTTPACRPAMCSTKAITCSKLPIPPSRCGSPARRGANSGAGCSVPKPAARAPAACSAALAIWPRRTRRQARPCWTRWSPPASCRQTAGTSGSPKGAACPASKRFWRWSAGRYWPAQRRPAGFPAGRRDSQRNGPIRC